MRTSVSLALAVLMLIAGLVVVPRSPEGVDPGRIVARVLRAEQPIVWSVRDEIRRAQRERCTPILEGSDRIDGRDVWAIRLKPPVRKYPWIEVWVDKRTGKVLGAKEWRKREGRVTSHELPAAN